MTHDVHELLDEAAPRPARAIDLDSVLGTARRRKRRGRAAAALAGALVIAAAAAGTVAVASGNGDSTPLAVRAAGPTTSIPDGWNRVNVDGKGVSLALPPGWTRQAPGTVPNEVVVVGSAGRPDPGFIGACTAPAPTGTIGTWVSLYEFPAGSTSVAEPLGDAVTVRTRPADFRNELLASGGCGTASTTTIAPSPPVFVNAFATVAFTDAGRVFLARIVTIGTKDQVPELRFGEAVLNTLHVDPVAGDATTTSAPDPSTTAPAGTDNGPVTTTLPPSAVGESADQLAIRTAFLGWLGTPQRDQVDEFVEDLASIRDAVRQGMAQHTPQDLAGYSGRVDSVTIVDPTHADVVYTVLHDDQPEFSNQPGRAVKVGGTWKVTRETECALLTYGNITCPARTTPVP